MINASPECAVDHKICLRRQTVSLTTHQTVFVAVRNLSDCVVELPRGCLVGRAVLKNPEDQAAQSPGYRLQFLRHYFSTKGAVEIHNLGSWVGFGPEKSVKLNKSKRTNFRQVYFFIEFLSVFHFPFFN